jgi:Fibronectin type III domain
VASTDQFVVGGKIAAGTSTAPSIALSSNNTDNTPTFTGLANADPVDLFVDGVQTGSTTRTGSSYSVTSSELSFGQHTARVTSGGQDSRDLTFTILAPPLPPPTPSTPALAADADGVMPASPSLTRDTTPSFTTSGTLSGTVVITQLGNTVAGPYAVPAGSSTITMDHFLADGGYSIRRTESSTLSSPNLVFNIDSKATDAPARASVTRLSGSSARLSWPAVSGAVEYQVRRISSAGMVTTAAPQSGSTWNIGVGSTVHKYYVRAADAAGNWSGWSAGRSVGRPGKVSLTGAKSGTPGGSVTARISWRAPDDNGNNITSYKVTAIRSNGSKKTFTVKSSARQLTVYGLVRNGKYRFQIQAVNEFGAGGLSNLSSQVTAR